MGDSVESTIIVSKTFPLNIRRAMTHRENGELSHQDQAVEKESIDVDGGTDNLKSSSEQDTHRPAHSKDLSLIDEPS
jgi:hypothetical protein